MTRAVVSKDTQSTELLLIDDKRKTLDTLALINFFANNVLFNYFSLLESTRRQGIVCCTARVLGLIIWRSVRQIDLHCDNERIRAIDNSIIARPANKQLLLLLLLLLLPPPPRSISQKRRLRRNRIRPIRPSVCPPLRHLSDCHRKNNTNRPIVVTVITASAGCRGPDTIAPVQSVPVGHLHWLSRRERRWRYGSGALNLGRRFIGYRHSLSLGGRSGSARRPVVGGNFVSPPSTLSIRRSRPLGRVQSLPPSQPTLLSQLRDGRRRRCLRARTAAAPAPATERRRHAATAQDSHTTEPQAPDVRKRTTTVCEETRRLTASADMTLTARRGSWRTVGSLRGPKVGCRSSGGGDDDGDGCLSPFLYLPLLCGRFRAADEARGSMPSVGARPCASDHDRRSVERHRRRSATAVGRPNRRQCRRRGGSAFPRRTARDAGRTGPSMMDLSNHGVLSE
jgi:hypothetical protein